MMTIRLALVTNIPAPYRQPVFALLGREADIALRVFFCSGREPDRDWSVPDLAFDHQFLQPRLFHWRERFIHTNPDIWRALRQFGPDVIITTGFNPTHLLGYLYARRHGRAHVPMTDGTLETDRALSPIHRLIRRIVFRHSSAFIGASEGSTRLYRAFGVDPSFIFKSQLCADNASFDRAAAAAAPPADRPIDFLFCGRFVESKGPMFALEVAIGAARRLQRRVSIAFVGSGPQERALRKRAAAHADQITAHFPGFAQQKDLPGHYLSSRVFLFPSQSERWGVVVNEACAAGLPVVASTKTVAAAELLSNGRSGFVLPLQLDMWVDEASRLLCDDELWHQLSTAGLQAIGEFTFDIAARGIASAARAAAANGRHVTKEAGDSKLPAAIVPLPKAPIRRCGRAERILIVHNAYQQRGGEDAVVDAEIELLARRGHAVDVYRRSSDDIAQISKVQLALGTVWSASSSTDVSERIARFEPDIVHVHNTVPLISPSVYWGAARAGVPVVQTLHNFRLLCPQGILLRDGRICEDCVGKLPWRGVVHGCYRGSRMQSAVLATSLVAHGAAGTYRRRVARFIALNAFCRQKFIDAGLPPERIVVKPNFVDAPALLLGHSRAGALFVGRLSHEKGVGVLIEAVTKSSPRPSLQVIGAGDLSADVQAAFGSDYLGFKSLSEIMRRMSQAAYLVLPSICYESFPRTVVEAFACGLPIIASRLGSLVDLVADGVTGLHFQPGDAADLARVLQWAETHPHEMREMGRRAREVYEAEYTPERNYVRLLEIYHQARSTETGRQSALPLPPTNPVDRFS